MPLRSDAATDIQIAHGNVETTAQIGEFLNGAQAFADFARSLSRALCSRQLEPQTAFRRRIASTDLNQQLG